jgi:hypothetical protein
LSVTLLVLLPEVILGPESMAARTPRGEHDPRVLLPLLRSRHRVPKVPPNRVVVEAGEEPVRGRSWG